MSVEYVSGENLAIKPTIPVGDYLLVAVEADEDTMPVQILSYAEIDRRYDSSIAPDLKNAWAVVQATANPAFVVVTYSTTTWLWDVIKGFSPDVIVPLGKEISDFELDELDEACAEGRSIFVCPAAAGDTYGDIGSLPVRETCYLYLTNGIIKVVDVDDPTEITDVSASVCAASMLTKLKDSDVFFRSPINKKTNQLDYVGGQDLESGLDYSNSEISYLAGLRVNTMRRSIRRGLVWATDKTYNESSDVLGYVQNVFLGNYVLKSLQRRLTHLIGQAASFGTEAEVERLCDEFLATLPIREWSVRATLDFKTIYVDLIVSVLNSVESISMTLKVSTGTS